MQSIPWQYLPDMDIVILVHDGGCSGYYGTVETRGAHGHTSLTLPTKGTWDLTRLGKPHGGDLQIVQLPLGSRGITPVCIFHHHPSGGVNNIGGRVRTTVNTVDLMNTVYHSKSS